MNSHPLISCICIANGKPAFFDKALACFEKQNYPNKELVVAYYKKDYHTQAVIEESITQQDSKILSITYCKESKEDIMKSAILKSTGFYICNWSEEAWHHESRLSYQYNSMQIVGERFQASILSSVWIHDYQKSQSYLSSALLWPETLLCRKEIILTNWGAEDGELSFKKIIALLSSKKMLYPIDKTPSLYITAQHNEDTSSRLDENTNHKIIELLS